MDASTFSSLLREDGYSVTLRRRPLPNGVATDKPITAAMRELTLESGDGVTVERDERKYLISAIDITPEPSPQEHSIIDDGMTRRVVKVRKVKRRSQILGYVLTVRG